MEKEYYSCNIIEHGFDAQIDSINLCCRVGKDHEAEKLVLIKNYDGKKIDWNKFFQLKKILREGQKAGCGALQCRGCIYIEKKCWDDEDYISSININNWIKCNADCIYCDRKFSKHKKEYNIYPMIRDLVKMGRLKPPYDITIAGGEPTITRDFDKTIDLLIKNNVSPVRVLTNAIKYNKYIEKGLGKGLVNILVSTDSGTRETYKKIKLTDKHNEVWKNIKRYANVQNQDSLVKTKYIIIPPVNVSKDEIKAYIEKNKESNVKYAHIDVEIGWFLRNTNNKEALKALLELFNFAGEYGKNAGVTILPFDRMSLIQKKFE